jgi:hypothetical protein
MLCPLERLLVLGHVLRARIRVSISHQDRQHFSKRNVTHLVQKLLQDLLLTDLHLTAGNGGVVNTQDSVDIVHALRPRVGQLLDLGGSVLDLLIGHLQFQLLGTALDGAAGGKVDVFSVDVLPIWLLTRRRDSLPTGQSVSDRDVSAHSKVLGLQDLVSSRVGQDGLGVDTSLVGEGAESSDVVVAVGRDSDISIAD